jgi:hypothetical protein
MRQAYAHEAVVSMKDGADTRAIGGAITVALCGALDHEPPCPLAAHATAAVESDGEVRVRVLFAADPARVDDIRDRIDAVIEAGTFTGPDGTTTRWRPIRAGCVRIVPEEHAHARRLLKC